MTIIEATPQEYDAHFAAYNSVFHSAAFAELHRNRCEEIKYLIFTQTSACAGIVLGRKGNDWFSPFSAPFGGFASSKKRMPIQLVEEMVDVFIQYLNDQGVNALKITMPPLFYQPSFLTKIQHVFSRKQLKITDWDLNYYLDTTGFGTQFVRERMSESAGKKYRKACKSGLVFKSGFGEVALRSAYEIILKNRTDKGYVLSMTLEQLLASAKIISVECFLVELDNQPIASAIVYKSTSNIAQVIYWGDLIDYQSLKTMYYLTYKVFEHYANAGVQFVDVGPAMFENAPNYGLCDFKESIGCDLQPKLTYLWKRS